jgi:putative hydrolase
MVGGIANPRTNILGHCTGRLIEGERGTRPESAFDAEVVFEACRTFDVAVEINSRPERRDPPTRLFEDGEWTWIACSPSTPTLTHLDSSNFQIYGCQRPRIWDWIQVGVINSWPVDELLDWCSKA